jgi:adenine/guanine/hypoxanthine permease
LASGIFVYAVLNGLVAIVVWASGGKLEPREYDLKEYWTWKGQGRLPWFVRAMQNRGRWWGQDDEDRKNNSNLSDENNSSFEHSRLGSADNKSRVDVVTVPQRTLSPHTLR